LIKLFIIDRFEEDWAIIEYNNKTFNLPKELLPSNAHEGDVLNISLSINIEATKGREERIQNLFDDLFES
jgi:hypothetical protein